MAPLSTLDYLTTKFNVIADKGFIEIPDTNREDLAQIINDLGFTTGAEVGVEQGLYSEVLLKNNPQLKLFCIDIWSSYGDYRNHVTNQEYEDIYQKARERLDPLGALILRGFSTEVAKDFEDDSLDFVYLDAGHDLLNVIQDLYAWYPKVKSGGIIAGHDYIKRKGGEKLIQVIYAVDAYVAANQIKPLFVLGRKDKVKGEKRDRTRSWFFVKP